MTLLVHVPRAKADAIDTFNAGFQAHKVNRFDLVISHYRKAIASGEIDDSRISYMHHYLDVNLSRTHRYKQALASFKRALALNPEIAITFRERGNVYALLVIKEKPLRTIQSPSATFLTIRIPDTIQDLRGMACVN